MNSFSSPFLVLNQHSSSSSTTATTTKTQIRYLSFRNPKTTMQSQLCVDIVSVAVKKHGTENKTNTHLLHDFIPLYQIQCSNYPAILLYIIDSKESNQKIHHLKLPFAEKQLTNSMTVGNSV